MASMIMNDKFGESNNSTTYLNGDVQPGNDLNANPMLNGVIRNDVSLFKRDEMKNSLSIDFSQPQSMRKQLFRRNYFGDFLTPQSGIGSPVLNDSILKTPDILKCLLASPEMEKLIIAKSPMAWTPLQHSPLASFKLFESLNDMNPGSLPSPSHFLVNQNLATRNEPNGDGFDQANDNQADCAGRSTASTENSDQPLVIDDKSSDQASNSDESQGSDKGDPEKAAKDFRALNFGAPKADQTTANQMDTSNSQPSISSHSNSPTPSISAANSRVSLQSASIAGSGSPFMGAYSAHPLHPMTPYYQNPMANQAPGLAATSNGFPPSAVYPPPLPPNHNLITNPPRLPNSYPPATTHPAQQMSHLANAAYPAIPPNFPMNPHAGYTISNQVNHFYNNQLAVVNRPPSHLPNAMTAKPCSPVVKETGGSSSGGSSSSEESNKRAKKDDSGGENIDEKKRKRNREAAERCRKRKLERFNNLEEQCSQYRNQLNQANVTIMRLSEKCQQLEHRWNQHISVDGCKMTAKGANER